MDAWWTRIKALDAYPKTLDDFRVKTKSGALLTLVTGFFIFILFVSEFIAFMRVGVRTDMSVDTSRNEKLKINFNVTFPRMACSVVSVDIMDISGEQQFDVEHTVLKKRLDSRGRPITQSPEERETKLGGQDVAALKNPKVNDPTYCGSCYGAEDTPNQCCNTCEQIREQYRKRGWAFVAADSMEQCVLEGFTEKLKSQVGEGCNLYGYIMVNKVAGNFHFAPGKSFQHSNMHVHDFLPFELQGFNMSHTIHSLQFGELVPGVVNPLDGVSKMEADGARMFQYFLKVVPTHYYFRSGRVVRTNQFSVTENERRVSPQTGHGLPGVFFMFDLSPIQVTYTEYSTSFTHFLTSLCAIVGGTFTVAGIIDSCVYHGVRSLRKKIELGKAS